MEKKKWEVTTVRHMMTRGGQNAGHFNSDLVFIEGAPFIVLVWLDYPDGQSRPDVAVALDPQHLQRLDWPDAEYLYQGTIEDPTQHN